jgi:nucleoside-diphosphate-sugar epimerase
VRYNLHVRILVVGCGYVGSRLAVKLAGDGHEVFGLSRSPTHEARLEAAGARLLLADITRPETLVPLPSNFDWVINCVSSASGGPAEYRRVYLEGTANLLEWLRMTPPARFLYTSSTGVYAQDDGSLVDESSPTDPDTETGRMLVATEQLLLKAAQRGFPAIVLRLAGIYGPGRGYWLRQFLSGQAVMNGKGERYLNMIHVDDVVGAIVATTVKASSGSVYNVVDNEPVQQITLFEWLSKTLGREVPPYGEAGGAARGRGATNKRVSNRKLTTELHYEFKYPTFREGYAAELPGIL